MNLQKDNLIMNIFCFLKTIYKNDNFRIIDKLYNTIVKAVVLNAAFC
jgi:hypothetical protein